MNKRTLIYLGVGAAVVAVYLAWKHSKEGQANESGTVGATPPAARLVNPTDYRIPSSGGVLSRSGVNFFR